MRRPTASDGFRVLLAVIVLTVITAPVLGAVADELNTSTVDEKETAPNPYTDVDVTKAEHPMSEGTGATALAGYYDDAGEWVPGTESALSVNTTRDLDSGDGVNRYSYDPVKVNEDSYGAFPDKSDNTILNASGWESGSAFAVSNTTVAANVDAVEFDSGTSGNSVTSAGDMVAEASYNKWDGELDSDESKRVLQVGVDVTTLEANAKVKIRIFDESGDYKQLHINDDNNVEGNVSMVANSTGTAVKQVKLNDLPTKGAGSWDNIENVSIAIEADSTSDADATLSVAWLDLRKKTRNVLGEKRTQDGDGDYRNFNTTYNATGTISVHGMDTLDSEYDDASIVDLSLPMHAPASKLDDRGEDGTYRFSFDEPDDPSFDATLNVTYAITLPSAIDLSYSNAEFRIEQKWAESRYVTLATAQDVTDSKNLSDVSLTDQTSSLSNKGDRVTVYSTGIDAGERNVMKIEIDVTEDERELLEQASSVGGGAGGPVAGGGGGIFGFFATTTGQIAGIVGGLISVAIGIPQAILRRLGIMG